ncbi:MAG: 4Fe-4S binding protein [Actinomycetota bacterium]|nr:4Fe-4S binding protein [Actinomycetota bacterium]
MAKRQIIKIDEQKCNGCGECVPNCPEGAIQLIDGKARLVSDLYCDGLGACIGDCPQGAINTEMREAKPYDENKVIKNIVKQGDRVIKAHLKHLKSHGQSQYLKQAQQYLHGQGIKIEDETDDMEGQQDSEKAEEAMYSGPPKLGNWPVQINLVPPAAAFLQDSELLVSADCVPFAYPGFHQLLEGKVVLVGCPKFDDAQVYMEKFLQIFSQNRIKSVTVVKMEVPCCSGMVRLVQEAVKASGKTIPFAQMTVTVKGEIK